MNKICSCGAHFLLEVELVLHRQRTGHPLAQPPPPPRPPRPIDLKGTPPVRVHYRAKAVRRSNWTGLGLGLSFLAWLMLTALLNWVLSHYIGWASTPNILILP